MIIMKGEGQTELVMEVLMDIQQCVQMMDGVAKFVYCITHIIYSYIVTCLLLNY